MRHKEWVLWDWDHAIPLAKQWLGCMMVCTRLGNGSNYHLGELLHSSATMWELVRCVYIPIVCDNICIMQSRPNMPR